MPTIRLNAGEKHAFVVPLFEGYRCEWKAAPVELDIAASVLFSVVEGQQVDVRSTETINSTELWEGEFTAKTAGNLQLLFDNTHSWFTAKAVKCNFIVINDIGEHVGARTHATPWSHEEEQESLVEFRNLLEERNVSPTAGFDLGDDNLLHFLRAEQLRAFDAYTRLVNTLEWREANGVDELEVNLERLSACDAQVVTSKRLPAPGCFGPVATEQPADFWDRFQGRCSACVATHGHTKDGNPLIISHPASIDWEYHGLYTTKNERMLFHICMNEIRRKLQNESYGLRSVIILDASGIALSLVSNMTLLDDLRTQISIDNMYPESLERLFFVNTHSVVMLFWGLLKYLVPRDVASKVVFLGSDFKEELLQIIDENQLPLYLGGAQPNPPWPGLE